MGHTNATLQSYYKKWIDQETLKQEREKFNQGLEVTVYRANERFTDINVGYDDPD